MNGASATSQLWMKACHTRRFLQTCVAHCFSEMMVELSHAETIDMDIATFHLWNRLAAAATFVTSATLSVFRNWTLFVKMVHLCWPARVWQGMRSCVLQQVGRTLRWTLTGKLPRGWMKTFTVSEWSCRMDSCWLHSDESIDQTFRSKLGRAGAVHSCGPGHRWTIRKITIHRWDSSLVPKRKLSPTSVETTGATSDRFCGVLTGCKVLRESLDESQDGIHWPILELCHRIGVYNYNDL